MGGSAVSPSHPIQNLSISNFGCLRDVSLDLEPLTVLIGPNDSGKTTILRALDALGRATRKGSRLRGPDGWRGVFDNQDDFNSITTDGDGNPFTIALNRSPVGPFRYSTTVGIDAVGPCVVRELLAMESNIGFHRSVGKSQQLELILSLNQTIVGSYGQSQGVPVVASPSSLSFSNDPVAHVPLQVGQWSEYCKILGAAIPRFQRYQFVPSALRSPVPVDEPVSQLEENGKGLAGYWAELLLTNGDLAKKIEENLSAFMPHVGRIHAIRLLRALTSSSGDSVMKPCFELSVRIKNGVSIPAKSVSDGVLLFLAFLLIANEAGEKPVLLIEEPETGVHPGLLKQICTLLRTLTTGGHGGPPAQVIVTTHSPLLLQHFEPNEIRVVVRGEDGYTQVVPFNGAPDIQRLLEFQGPGELWANNGDEFFRSVARAGE
jgi:predicted ATPase